MPSQLSRALGQGDYHHMPFSHLLRWARESSSWRNWLAAACARPRPASQKTHCCAAAPWAQVGQSICESSAHAPAVGTTAHSWPSSRRGNGCSRRHPAHVDSVGKVGEVRAVLHRVVLVGQHQGVVLVGAGRFALPRLRPCGHPHPGHRRRPELLLGQGTEAVVTASVTVVTMRPMPCAPAPPCTRACCRAGTRAPRPASGNVRCLVNAPG